MSRGKFARELINKSLCAREAKPRVTVMTTRALYCGSRVDLESVSLLQRVHYAFTGVKFCHYKLTETGREQVNNNAESDFRTHEQV